MKTRLIILLSILSLHLQGQVPATTVHLIGPLPQYRGVGLNLKIPILQSLPADADSTRARTGHIGQRYPLIIGLHGAGEKTTSYASASTVGTADINKLFNTSLPSLLRYTESPLYNKRFAAPGRTDSTSFIYLFPQTYGGHSVTYQTYVYNTIKFAKETLGDILDTTRIYLVGLSLGGYGVINALQDTNVLKDVAAGLASCPGGINPIFAPYDFQHMADWGGLLILQHSTNDSTTDKNPTTKEGSYYSDRIRDSLYKWKGRTHFVYRRWITGGHTIWDRAQNFANYVNAYPQSNNQNGGFPVPFQSLFLLYRRPTTIHSVYP